MEEAWLYQTKQVGATQLQQTIAGMGAGGWECVGIAPAKLSIPRQQNDYETATVTEYVLVLRQRFRR